MPTDYHTTVSQEFQARFDNTDDNHVETPLPMKDQPTAKPSIDQRAREAAEKVCLELGVPSLGLFGKKMYNTFVAALTAQHAEDVAAGEKKDAALRDSIARISGLGATCIQVAQQLGYKDWSFIFSAPNNGGDTNTKWMAELIEDLTASKNHSCNTDLQVAALTQPT